MPHPSVLNERLDAVARTLRESGLGLGVLALGSVGEETFRLDRWSDLDFFLIVRPGAKAALLADSGWFDRVAPTSWVFRNTGDGYKVLFADGVFGEMAWFEPEELPGIPYSPGRWIWRDDSLPDSFRVSARPPGPRRPTDAAWVLGELLSCLYVGLARWHRGERLSAWRFVQGHSLDRFLELVDLVEPVEQPPADPYNRDRRWEFRHPSLAELVAELTAGYKATPHSALTLLSWCEQRFEVSAGLASEIRRLALENG